MNGKKKWQVKNFLTGRKPLSQKVTKLPFKRKEKRREERERERGAQIYSTYYRGQNVSHLAC